MHVVVSQFEGIDVTPVLPLAAGCLVATARADADLARAARFAIAIERRSIAEAVADLEGPDVFGVSLYPWNIAYSLAVAEAVRAAHPGCLIIAGGPAVPRRPAAAFGFLDEHPALDLLVFAEGEPAFRDILRARLGGTAFDHIGGIAIADRATGGGHRVTAPPARVLDLADTASPYLDGTFDELFERHRDRFTMALLETNRGCPFSCTFCDWSLTKHVVEYPIERVHAELDWLARRRFGHIMVADANFGIRPRDAAIARYLAGLREQRGAPRSVYFYLTKNNHARNLETIDIFQEADIATWVGLAVQDFDDDVLAAVERSNIQTGETMKLREICRDRAVPTFNELILGLPGQTYASFTTSIVRAMPAMPRHDFVVFLCRLLDNTELGAPQSRARLGIETRRCEWKTSSLDWDPIVDERQELVVATRDMPIDAWQRTFRFTFVAAALYNHRLLRVVLHHVTDAGLDLRDYLELLVARTGDAASGTVYAELGAVLDRYVQSILAEGPFILPVDDGAPVSVDEALAVAALARYDAFLAETERHTRAAFAAAGIAAPAALAEAFGYQSLITPRWRRTERSVVGFEHDWPAYVAAGGTGAALAARPTTVTYAPPAYAAVPDFVAFATTHLGCIRARLDAGTVEPGAPVDPDSVAGGRRPPALVVLPTSG